MEELSEFQRRQRDAGGKLVAAIARLVAATDRFTSQSAEALPRLQAVPDAASRYRILLEALTDLLVAEAESARSEVREITAAAAELSDNWHAHERDWDSLAPDELSRVLDIQRAIESQRQAASGARSTVAVRRESLADLAALGPEMERVVSQRLAALAGEDAALSEIQALSEAQLATIKEIVRRLEG